MKKHFEKIWFILGNSKRKLPLLITILIFSSVTETLGIGLLGPFFSIAINPEKARDIPFSSSMYRGLGITSDAEFISILGVFIVVIFFVKGGLYFLSKYYTLRFSHLHTKLIIEKLNYSYLHSDYNFFSQKNSANLTKNIIVETQQFQSNVLLSLLYGFSNILILSLLLLLLSVSNSSLLIVTTMALLPILVVLFLMKAKLKNWGMLLSVSKQNMIKVLNHGLGGLKEVRIIGCESYFQSQMESETYQYAKIAPRLQSFQMLPRIMIESSTIAFIITYIVIVNAIFPERSESLVSSMSIFAIASIRILPAASQVMNTLSNLPSSKHTVDVLYSDLKDVEKHTVQVHETLVNDKKYYVENKTSFSDLIELKNISYAYPGSETHSISQASLNIKKGQSIALIGKSGSGKTTLADIFLGLLTPEQGDIAVDGVSIYTNLRSWQNLLGYIPQSIFLLDDTVERNIAFGVPDHLIDHKRLEEAIIASQLEELINTLPKGLYTRIGERGIMLSGGQRQRIGIARALYHEREILVLDEATSALDNKTEQLVSDSIKALSGKKTIIIIAHRLSTVEHCDTIYLLEQGKVIKEGSFSEVVGFRKV